MTSNYFTDYSNIIHDAVYLKNKGKNYKQIADYFNLKYHQVVYMFRKYNLPQNYFWMSALEKQYIKENQLLGTIKLSKILNRSPATISRYQNNQFFFTNEEKNFIKENSHLTSYRLAMIMNRSRSQIWKIKNNIN